METQNTTTAQEPKPVRGQGVLEWYEALISAALVLVLVFSFFFRIIQVDGSSMVPTLVNGDKLIVWGAGYTPQRGDVVVVDDDAQPLVLCECKAPEIPIDRHVLAQAVRYNSVLGARYLVLTNGRSHYCYELVEGEYRQCDRFPSIGSGMGD